MGTVTSRARGRTTPTSLLTLAAVVLALFGNPALTNAAHRVAMAPRAAANVLVEPYDSKTLWVGTMDPAAVTLLRDNDILQKIYAGLLKQAYDDKTGKFRIEPDLADGMPTVSKDGLVYTFKIRSDARFSDGTPVTAQDFAYSLNRVLNPKEQSPVTYYLNAILGATDVAAGKARTCKGIKVIDAHTLQITLNKPATYFLYALTYNTGDVLKQNVPPGADMATKPSLVVGAGPWMLKGGTWKYRSQITLVPNPYYWEAKRFKLKEIDLVFTGSVESEFNAYKSGQFPMAGLPAVEVARYRGTPEFRETPTLGDLWYAMNVKMAPFDNLHFRRAVAFAINRNALVYGTEHGTVVPLDGWYPKGILGYDPTIRNKVPHYDPAMARKELALAMKALKRMPTTIELEYPSESQDVARDVAQVQSDLKAVGIPIGLHPVPQATWSSDTAAKKSAFTINDWFDDYPDPQDFSDYLLQTGAGQNSSNYSNPTVDALFARAEVTQDTATRERLYRQAQLIALNDAPVAMAYQYASS